MKAGETLAILYSGKQTGFAASEERLLQATKLGKTAPENAPLILDVVE